MAHLGGPNPTAPALSPNQLRTIRIIALASSSVTLIAAAIVLHWFVRMKRSFRRQLIMILILCDSFKSLWSFIFPAVALANGGAKPANDFCQTTGFFYAAGIEAADLCILFIAVHAAVTIFLPRTGPTGKAGLYRFRHAVYFIIIAVPLLMAGLAFTNKQAAFVAQTAWCYLPVRPFWYRLALAWIPRYVIIISITGLYLAIYIYVKITFRAYRAHFRTSDFDTDATQASQLDNSRCRSSERRGSTLSVFGATFKIPSVGKGEKPTEGGLDNSPAVPRIRRFSASDHFASPDHAEAGDRATDIEKGMISQNRSNSNPDSGRAEGLPDAPAENNWGIGTADGSTSQAITGSSINQFSGSPTTNSENELLKRQYAIERQLRFLFIYPCVYVLVWLVPLINHSLQYEERWAERPSFPLVCITAFVIPFQGTIDCLLFSLRERPWRLVRKQSKQPFLSWLFRRHWEDTSESGPINLEAMTDSQRHAYLRREREEAENRQAKRERQEKKKRARMVRKNSMTWWDTFERTNGSGIAVARQDPEVPGGDMLAVPSTALTGDGKSITRNGSFSSFASLGRRRSRSGTDLWKGFSFADSGNRQGSTSTRSNSGPLDSAIPVAPTVIPAIQEEQNGLVGTDGEVPPSPKLQSTGDIAMSSRSADSTTPLVRHDLGVAMKGLPVLPRK
ncbi:hypothetical protein DRE_00827 [Drechslerella stenobrocha 248]|uniref:G-protein coupled receptors family 1 profile domain-containing protein n=1 Tax=Drechslerella stenobrocha 248 TaxID=1043628 RepID=W7HZR0_9PEZI|nr:hypothetical protein DRE_00827 [Drechslerella stenobrocha 248]